jgi:hypothetical protein
MNNVVQFPTEPEGPPDMRGAERGGCHVVLDGREAPKLHMYERGEEIDFILDGRFSYVLPKEYAYLAAHFAATAMAIGAGYAFFDAETKDRPFASKVHRIEFAD